MADPFSTLAGVVSVIDVAIRGCRGLYDFSRNLEDVPRSAQQLRSTIGNVESCLRNLRLFAIEYQSSAPLTGHHQILPEALKLGLLGVKTELNVLNRFLPNSESSWKVSERVTWVIDKNKLIKTLQRLDSQQITLLVGLQSVSQYVVLYNIKSCAPSMSSERFSGGLRLWQLHICSAELLSTINLF